MKIETSDKDKVIQALVDLKGYSKGINMRSAIWKALEKFAQDRRVEICIVKALGSRMAAWGAFSPALKLIFIQDREETKMLPTLAHEIGHLILFQAGCCKKYEFEEDLAEVIGDTAISLLAQP